MEYELSFDFAGEMPLSKIVSAIASCDTENLNPFWIDIASRMAKFGCAKLYNEYMKCEFRYHIHCMVVIMGIKIINAENFSHAKSILGNTKFTSPEVVAMFDYCDVSDIDKLVCVGKILPSAVESVYYKISRNREFYINLKKRAEELNPGKHFDH